MRPVVSWMTRSDDAILEFLADHDIALPPTAISYNIDNMSRPTVDRRLPNLEVAGLVKRHDAPQGYTEITERGRAYLSGDIDSEELENVLE